MLEAIFFWVLVIIGQVIFWWKYSVMFFASSGKNFKSAEHILDWFTALFYFLPSIVHLIYFLFFDKYAITVIFFSMYGAATIIMIGKSKIIHFMDIIKVRSLMYEPSENILDVSAAENQVDKKLNFPPDELRTEHMMIVASSGHGKTQLLQQMLVHDLKSNYPIVVLDSQQSMLEKLLHVLPPDQLVYLDGATNLAICPFDIGDTSDTVKVNTAISLYENMFEALGTELTTKQATVFRYISRLLVEVPGATFTDMLNVLQHGTSNYSGHVAKLPDMAQRFLSEQLMGKSFGQTREQVSERLYTLLENENFDRMFSAKRSQVDLSTAIRQRKIILINTAQDVLGIQGAALFGRYCLLQIGLEVLRRPATSDRVYFYIDEAQEVLGDSTIIERLFEQGRKRGLCMVCAFHRLGQLSPNLVDLMRTNTAIKAIGAINATDAGVLAKDVGFLSRSTDEQYGADVLVSVPKLTFWAAARGYTTKRFTVTPGYLESKPKRTPREIQSIKAQQTALWAAEPVKHAPNPPAPKPFDPDGPQSLD